MAYNYRVRKKVDKSKPEKQVRYYAVPVSSKLADCIEFVDSQWIQIRLYNGLYG